MLNFFLDDLTITQNNDLLLFKMLSSAYLFLKTENNLVGRKTRALEQMTSIISNLHIITALLFY